jgi:phenylpyruvate tautomerase PptA (4-oxalocrotonate tautomerase family)
MPYIQIFEAQQRTDDEAQDIIRAVTAAYSEAGNIPVGKVQVVLSPVSRAHWGTGGRTLKAQDEEARG